MAKQLIIMASALMLFGCQGVKPKTEYTITNLGTLGGKSAAERINNNSQIIGYSWGSTTKYSNDFKVYHAYLYEGNVMKDLGTLGGDFSVACGINDSGQIVGWSFITGNAITHSFLYNGTIRNTPMTTGTEKGGRSTMYDLGTLGGTGSCARGINNKGQVVGHSKDVNGFNHAFLYDGAIMKDLGTLGGSHSEAYGINDNGQVVGMSQTTGNSCRHVFFYDGTTMKDLGTLGGNQARAYGINDKGQVVGVSRITGNSSEHAFLYNSTSMKDLGTLGGNNSMAWCINNKGQVVGYSEYMTGNSSEHAFLYEGDNMIDLNNLLPPDSGWELIAACGINNLGQIVGNGKINGEIRGFLMTPKSP